MNNAQLLLIEQQWDSNVVRLRPIRTHDILQRQDTLGKGKLRSPVGGTNNYLCKCDLAGYEMEICLPVLICVPYGYQYSITCLLVK